MNEKCISEGDIMEALQYAKSAHHRADSIEKRLDKIEDSQEILYNMNTNLEKLIEQNKYRDKQIQSNTDNINILKDKPAKRWDDLIKTIITVITTALVTAFVAGVFK
ncbi:MAG: hypothetical protein N4A63_05170 [Vallitalea sp.]|jgi:hypothetical protein|nr:hypothetical protein [Vallitalea sp.]